MDAFTSICTGLFVYLCIGGFVAGFWGNFQDMTSDDAVKMCIIIGGWPIVLSVFLGTLAAGLIRRNLIKLKRVDREESKGPSIQT